MKYRGRVWAHLAVAGTLLVVVSSAAWSQIQPPATLQPTPPGQLVQQPANPPASPLPQQQAQAAAPAPTAAAPDVALPPEIIDAVARIGERLDSRARVRFGKRC